MKRALYLFLLAAAVLARAAPEPALSLDGRHRCFFGFGKSMVRNPVAQQRLGVDALESVNAGLARLGFECRVLRDPVRSLDDFTRQPTPFLVTSASVTNALLSYRQALATQDVIVVYSHSHGLTGQFGKPGGMALDDPGVGERKRPPILAWDDYAEQLLGLPAKTVVVLTMACHSGALVEYLNSNESARTRMQARREQGRNLLVITSQNAHALSNPRLIEGRLVNPFTYAVSQAFGGAADGYQRGRAEKCPDGRLTLGELVTFVVDEAKKYTRAGDTENDADPQVAGCFDAETVIATLPQTHPSAP